VTVSLFEVPVTRICLVTDSPSAVAIPSPALANAHDNLLRLDRAAMPVGNRSANHVAFVSAQRIEVGMQCRMRLLLRAVNSAKTTSE
jgi:hypothetical protein